MDLWNFQISIPLDEDDFEDVLLLVDPKRPKSAAVDPRRVRQLARKKKEKPARHNFPETKPIKNARGVARDSEDSVSDSGCPFVLKQTQSHCQDLTSILSRIGVENKDVPTKGDPILMSRSDLG